MKTPRPLGFRKSKYDPLSLTVNDVVMFLYENCATELAEELSLRANKAETKLDKRLNSEAYASTWTAGLEPLDKIKAGLSKKWWRTLW